MSETTHFVVTYRNPEKSSEIIEVRVHSVDDSVLGPAFIALSGFLFHSATGLINPRDEYAKKRFQKTKTLHISIYNIITIEEVGDDHPGLHLAPKEGQLLSFDPDRTRT